MDRGSSVENHGKSCRKQGFSCGHEWNTFDTGGVTLQHKTTIIGWRKEYCGNSNSSSSAKVSAMPYTEVVDELWVSRDPPAALHGCMSLLPLGDDVCCGVQIPAHTAIHRDSAVLRAILGSSPARQAASLISQKLQVGFLRALPTLIQRRTAAQGRK